MWYHVLAEASEETGDETFDPVGSYLVAETIIGLIDADPRLYRSLQPNWKPSLPTLISSHPEEYGMTDLVAFALNYDV